MGTSSSIIGGDNLFSFHFDQEQVIYSYSQSLSVGTSATSLRRQCDTIHQVSLTYSAYFRSSRKQRKEFSLKAVRQSAASCGLCARNVCAPLFIVRGDTGDTVTICSFILNSSPGPQLPPSTALVSSPASCLAHQIMCGLQFFDYLIFPPCPGAPAPARCPVVTCRYL